VQLLRFRPTTRTVRLALPDGSTRAVKVSTNDAGDGQHVEDWEGHIHATARPAPVAMTLHQGPVQRRPLLLRNMGMPKMRQAYKADHDTGLWAPVPGTEQMQ
jgi:hypothetical protein